MGRISRIDYYYPSPTYPAHPVIKFFEELPDVGTSTIRFPVKTAVLREMLAFFLTDVYTVPFIVYSC